MRINKYIARSGYTSRRKADELIFEKRVTINNQLVEKPGSEANDKDVVKVDGKIIKLENFVYYKLNKPVGYISSNYDPHNPLDLKKLVDIKQRVYPAGRLDKDSHGLILMTNDGNLVNKIIHPKNKINKEYIVRVSELLDSKQIKKIQKPLNIGNKEITSGADIKLIDKNTKTYKVIIHQGFNRQIRRMFQVFNIKVLDLKRVAIGKIKLLNLKEGNFIKLNGEELSYLKTLK